MRPEQRFLLVRHSRFFLPDSGLDIHFALRIQARTGLCKERFLLVPERVLAYRRYGLTRQSVQLVMLRLHHRLMFPDGILGNDPILFHFCFDGFNHTLGQLRTIEIADRPVHNFG